MPGCRVLQIVLRKRGIPPEGNGKFSWEGGIFYWCRNLTRSDFDIQTFFKNKNIILLTLNLEVWSQNENVIEKMNTANNEVFFGLYLKIVNEPLVGESTGGIFPVAGGGKSKYAASWGGGTPLSPPPPSPNSPSMEHCEMWNYKPLFNIEAGEVCSRQEEFVICVCRFAESFCSSA